MYTTKETVAFVSEAQIEEMIEKLDAKYELGKDWAWRDAILEMTYHYHVPGEEPSNMVAVADVNRRLEEMFEERKQKAA